MIVVIPARHDSTRLPGKPLLDIGGRPMIAHVVARAIEAQPDRVVVATDDTRIAQAAREAGAEACLTGSHHVSGTTRIAEVVEKLGIDHDEIVVNVQGDEPLIPPAIIRRVAEVLAADADAAMATACTPMTDMAAFHNPNVVKVVRDAQDRALYFSRAPIPWPCTDGLPIAFRHLGLYAYRAGFVCRYAAWPVSPLEEIESLEQLRVLWQGGVIALFNVEPAPPAGVDTMEDLDRVRALVSGCRR